MLNSPHITLGLDIADGLIILSSLGAIHECRDSEHYYKSELANYKVAIYEEDGLVSSVWYDDSIGRETSAGREQKVRLYLIRYGELCNWELRMDNGWMHYWFNPKDHVAMVYGIHKDVIRFNRYSESEKQ